MEDKVAREVKAYMPIPVITPFWDENGNDIMQQQVRRNYERIKSEVKKIIEDEKTRIKHDPELKHLLNENKAE
jgi:hypothetical protein